MTGAVSDKSNHRNLILFFTSVYLFSWLFWIPEALAVNGMVLPPPLKKFLSGPFNPAAFGPLVAAIVITLSNDGKKGLIPLLRRGIDFRFRKVWLIPVFFLFPLIY